MPQLNWPTDPLPLIQAFETRHGAPDSGALFSWAAWAVESLHYLDDIDNTYNSSHTTIGGHRPDVVDVAHARWATGTAITAIDLCAAGLGRAFCGQKGNKELALVQFDLTQPQKKKQREEIQRRRDQLPVCAREWVDKVLADAQYITIKKARHWLTHARIRRHFTLATGGPPQRLKLELTTQIPVRQLIEEARDCATTYIQEFVEILPRL